MVDGLIYAVVKEIKTTVLKDYRSYYNFYQNVQDTNHNVKEVKKVEDY